MKWYILTLQNFEVKFKLKILTKTIIVKDII